MALPLSLRWAVIVWFALSTALGMSAAAILPDAAEGLQNLLAGVMGGAFGLITIPWSIRKGEAA